MRICTVGPLRAAAVKESEERPVSDILEESDVRFGQVCGESEAGKISAGLPVEEIRVTVLGNEGSPFTLRPVVKLRLAPMRAVLFVGQHDSTQAASPV